jgi:hypothetical protein
LAGVVVKHYRRAIVVVALKVLSSGAAWISIFLRYWYKSTNTDAAAAAALKVLSSGAAWSEVVAMAAVSSICTFVPVKQVNSVFVLLYQAMAMAAVSREARLRQNEATGSQATSVCGLKLLVYAPLSY